MRNAPEAARQTKIFGLRIGVDPKILGGGLAVLTLFFLWFNLRGSDDDEHTANAGSAAAVRPHVPSPVSHSPARRSHAPPRDRGTLSMKPVDPTRGDIDPTLRLGLLERMKALQFHEGGRNLFEAGPELAAGNLPPVPKGPTMMPKPITPPVIAAQNSGPAVMPVNIPFKYYGFVKPAGSGESNRGFFMEEDNVLVGVEGDMLKSRFLIVSLTPTSARIEDTQTRQGQDLMVAPQAVSQ
jgi:hypothetical protein